MQLYNNSQENQVQELDRQETINNPTQPELIDTSSDPLSRLNPDSESKPTNNAPDPFDPESLRLTQDFGSTIGVKKELLTVPVRKPAREWWVRCHPDQSYRIQTAVLELKEDREVYLVAPALWPELATEATFGTRAIFTAINRQGVVFLWPVRLPGADGRIDEWSRSALEAASLARDTWVRVIANMSLGAYEVLSTTADLPAPTWPDKPLCDLLRTGFKDRFIDTLEHPVLSRLRGEV